MAKSRQQKESELTDLLEKWQRSKSVVFAQTMGLSVPDAQTLRRELKAAGSEMVVAKKTLVGLLLEKGNLPKDTVNSMEGGVAVIFGYEDEVSPAKVVATFAKDHEQVTFHAGVLDGGFIDAAAVTNLSSLPTKPELLAKLVGSLSSPMRGIVTVLSGPARGLVQALHQISEQKSA